jgi:hypothetical protein
VDQVVFGGADNRAVKGESNRHVLAGGKKTEKCGDRGIAEECKFPKLLV